MKKYIFKIIFILFISTPAQADKVRIKCENSFSRISEMLSLSFEKEQCDKYGKEKWDINLEQFGSCSGLQLKTRKLKVCNLLYENRLIDWTHQQFIIIPEFKNKLGIAKFFSIPCWEYGSTTDEVEVTYIIKNNILAIQDGDYSAFNIDLNTFRAGYGNNLEYACEIWENKKNMFIE